MPPPARTGPPPALFGLSLPTSFVVWVILYSLALLGLAGAVWNTEFGTTCVVDRFELQAEPHVLFLGRHASAVLGQIFWTLLPICLGLGMWGYRAHMNPTWARLVATGCRMGGLGVLLYLVGFAQVQVGRAVIGDSLCSTTPNAVSGHVHFIVWWQGVMMLLPGGGHPKTWTATRSGRRARPWVRWAFWGVYACFWALGFGVLTQTYSGGYHTLRQICLGGLIAVLHLAVTWPLISWNWFDPAFPFRSWAGGVIAACLAWNVLSLAALVWAWATQPLTPTPPAIWVITGIGVALLSSGAAGTWFLPTNEPSFPPEIAS